MVRLLHAGDFHLDSAFTALTPEQSRLRRTESRRTPERLVEWANDHGVQLLLLAGDLFDSASLYGDTAPLLAQALARFRGQAVQLILLALEGRFACVEIVRLLVEGFLSLGHTALAALNLGAAVADLAIQFILQANDFFFRLKDAFLLLLFRTTLRVFQQISGIFFRTPDILFLNIFPIHVACRTARRKRGDDCQQGQQKRQSASHSFFAEFSISFQIQMGKAKKYAD